jgi:hypothetical protein
MAMSKGDNLIGKETIYKGIVMKSRFETKIAFFLDSLKIKWEYEPKAFMLSDGTTYIPDFYLIEHKMWIEAKGVIEEHNKNLSKLFVKEIKQHLILMAPTEGFYYGNEYWDEEGDEICEDEIIYLGKCSHCHSYFFSSNYGIYNCKKCNAHEGDHDLICSIYEYIDFSNLDSIKEGLLKYGSSI